MKKQLSISVLALFLAAFFTQLSAQNENVWLGGKPGRSHDWNTAANWSKQRVPSEFDDVFIPNTATTTRSYPILNGTVEVQSICLADDANLVMNTGALIIAYPSDDRVIAFAKPQTENGQPCLVETLPTMMAGPKEVLAGIR